MNVDTTGIREVYTTSNGVSGIQIKKMRKKTLNLMLTELAGLRIQIIRFTWKRKSDYDQRKNFYKTSEDHKKLLKFLDLILRFLPLKIITPPSNDLASLFLIRNSLKRIPSKNSNIR